MRNAFADTFYEEAQRDERLCAVVADLSPAGSMEKFRKSFPTRFINTGVAEQIMIGIVAGMALRGLRPFAYTIGTFALFRPYEFVRDDLCYQNLPVTVVGIGGGVNYSTLGSTHHAMEDVALASALPNMQVLAPCDPAEVREATLWCVHENQGPVYLRLARAGDPMLTQNAAEPWRFGKLRTLRRGNGDICLLGYGGIMKQVVAAADRLEAQGHRVSVVSAHTLKPLDLAGLREMLVHHRRIVVVEEMVPQGGLADRVKVLAFEERADCRIEAVALKDEFIHCYGSHDQVLAAHGISVEAIVARAVA